MNRQPPALAERLLRRALGPTRWADTILGDLHEEHARAVSSGRRGATLWYWAQAMRLATRYTATRYARRLTRGAPPAPIDAPHGDSIVRTIALETRHGVRALRKRPLPTAIVVVTLALCLGANAAIFAIVDSLVIRPFRFHEPDRIAFVAQTAPDRGDYDYRQETASPANFLDWRRQANRGRGARVYTLTQGMMDIGLGPILSMWQASALFVLLIGCANIANLLLARAAERERELAVRLAIGASRARVIRQLLIESVILGLVAVPGALLAAHAGLKLLVSYMPARIARFVPGWHEIDVDGRLLAVTVVLAFGTAIAFGLLPAWHSSRPRIADTLKSGGRSITGSRNRLRRTLAIAEVALALPLLVAAGLSAVGVNRFLNGPQGYNPDGVLAMRAVLSEGRHPDAAAWRRFAEQAVDRLAAMPGVEAAAAANSMPSMQTGAAREIEIDGQALPEAGSRPISRYSLVTPRLFDVLQLPVVSGRAFSTADRDGSQPVAIVSESLARRHWPGVDPIGRRLRIVDGEWLTVVGVCGDVVHDWFGARNSPTLYRPYSQAPTGFMALAVRTSGDPKHAVGDAVKAIAAVDSMQPVFDVMTYRELLKDRTLGLQYVAAIMATFGVFALVLAVVGVYSVMAYLVTQRTHEIGVRMALGATHADVMKLTVGQAGRLTAIGVAIGTLLAGALGRLIEAGLLGVVANDYRMVAGFGVVLVGAALLAGYLPARRAAAIDPAVALRAE